jgi:hypothetical protein
MTAHTDFAAAEKNIVQDFKTNPNDVQPIFKELQQLQTSESASQFKTDLTKLNTDLQNQGLLPKLDLISADPTATDGFTIGPLPPPPADTSPPPSSSPQDSQSGEQPWINPNGDTSGGGGGGGSSGGGGGGGGSDSGVSSGGGSSGGGGSGGDSSVGTAGNGNVSGGSIDTGSNSSLPDLSSPDISKFYEYPITGAAVNNPERVDQGVDFGGSGQFKAIGNSVVDAIIPNWYQGQPLMEMTLTDGPLKGKQYYVAEGINPLAKVGDQVQKGQVIANITGGPTGIETGWGAGGGKTLAQATSGYTEGQATPAGQSFSQFLQKLGGPGGR